MGSLCGFFFRPSTRQVTIGGLDGGLVIGCGEGDLQVFPVKLCVDLLKNNRTICSCTNISRQVMGCLNIT